MSNVSTVKDIADAATDAGVGADQNTIGFTMGFLAAASTAANASGKPVNQYDGKEDGWWTAWNGPDVDLTLDEKVERAASIAEEVTKDYVRSFFCRLLSSFVVVAVIVAVYDCALFGTAPSSNGQWVPRLMCCSVRAAVGVG